MNNYSIVTGYYHSPGQEAWAEWFFSLWCRVNRPHLEAAQKVFLIPNGGCTPFNERVSETLLDEWLANDKFSHIWLAGNCGHVHQLIGKQEPSKRHGYCGWSSVVLSGAMLCYANETDMVFVEQDALLFGDCIGQMYRELGDGEMIFGKSKVMPCAQSLFLVRHHWIPDFVRTYLYFKNDRYVDFLPEIKFSMMHKHKPTHIKQFSFPFDRDRPLDMSLPVWYGQKFTPDELRECERMGLLTLPPNMPDVKAFTGDTTGL